MREAERMREITRKARSNGYAEEYKKVIQNIESVARSGRSRLNVYYEDEVTRTAISALLKLEGFHTRLMGEDRLLIYWDL